MAGRCVCGLRKQEPDSHFTNGHPYAHARQIHTHTERFQHVRRAAARTSRAVAVLCHTRAGGSRHNCRGRRNVKRIETVAAGPAGIDHAFRARLPGREYASGMTPHHRSKSRKLRDKDWSHVQRSQKAHNLGRTHAAGKQFFHHRFSVGT